MIRIVLISAFSLVAIAARAQPAATDVKACVAQVKKENEFARSGGIFFIDAGLRGAR